MLDLYTVNRSLSTRDKFIVAFVLVEPLYKGQVSFVVEPLYKGQV